MRECERERERIGETIVGIYILTFHNTMAGECFNQKKKNNRWKREENEEIEVTKRERERV